jgi:hypothetical protein
MSLTCCQNMIRCLRGGGFAFLPPAWISFLCVGLSYLGFYSFVLISVRNAALMCAMATDARTGTPGDLTTAPEVTVKTFTEVIFQLFFSPLGKRTNTVSLSSSAPL